LQIFNEIIDEYLLSLSEKKRSKALITEDTANEYLQILNNPQNTSIANSNICYQVKNSYSSLKKRLYYIIAEEHLPIEHKSAKATYKQVSHKYHGVKRYLLEDCQNKNEDLYWTVGLATIIYSMNLFVCCATNKRPFELVFGHEPHGNCVLIDQLWSQGVQYEENIPDNIQIEDYDNI
ncbi:17934_t:CDS:2, partial [Gigaspora margarita]